MKVGILKTNGGPHPPAKWAEQTAERLVDVIEIEPTSPVFEKASTEKDDFEEALAAALVTHHSGIQSAEKDHLTKKGDARLMEPVTLNLDEAIKAVQGCADKTMFGPHFRKPATVDFVAATLASHFKTVIHIERSWHADRNPTTPGAKAFRARYHSGPKGA